MTTAIPPVQHVPLHYRRPVYEPPAQPANPPHLPFSYYPLAQDTVTISKVGMGVSAGVSPNVNKANSEAATASSVSKSRAGARGTTDVLA